jgi:glucose-1-phosphate thymidylyltransferase
MSEGLKIVIPMGGYGTRLRPHTWSKPKPLVYLAGKTVLDYVLDQMSTLNNLDQSEFVFIIGPQGEQIRSHMERFHPEKKVNYAIQNEMKGQSHAIYQARDYLQGPMLLVFSDTLTEVDLSVLEKEQSDGIIWVKQVPDPRRFGVVKTDAHGRVESLIEKPSDMSNNLAVVGFYYFKDASQLLSGIEEQMTKGITLKNEYFLADAINILLERGLNIRAEEVDVWLDAGTPGTLLETNRYLLEKRHDNSTNYKEHPGITVIPPVYIPESVHLENVVIGPNVSLGDGCVLKNVIIRDSIVGENSDITQIFLEKSLIGREVKVHGQALSLNLGDESSAT